MNTKIFNLLLENLQDRFKLKKYSRIFSTIDKNTEIEKLPWTPANYAKFKDSIRNELQLDSDYVGTVEAIVDELDMK